MTMPSWWLLTVYLTTLLSLVKPLGLYMTTLMDAPRWLPLAKVERGLFRLCGIGHEIHTLDGAVETRSLMIADLDKPTSIQLQEQGVGPLRHFGCGIFLPHKGIRAVGAEEDRSHFSGT